MSGRYLTDLAEVCRRSGLVVYEQEGWETRARSSGGYSDGRPDHVMVHHTASNPPSDGWPDCDYCSYNSDIAPVTNLYLSRAGEVYVLAAGATNTNGSGSDPCSDVADDSMNTHAIAIEAANDGVGEPWPAAQQDAYLILVSTLLDAYAISPGRVHAHAEWAGSRKIDPAGPSRWAPTPDGGTWQMDTFRDELVAPDPEGDSMLFRTVQTGDALYVQGDDLAVRHVTGYEGAIAEAASPGWADGAQQLDGLAPDVIAWLGTL